MTIVSEYVFIIGGGKKPLHEQSTKPTNFKLTQTYSLLWTWLEAKRSKSKVVRVVHQVLIKNIKTDHNAPNVFKPYTMKIQKDLQVTLAKQIEEFLKKFEIKRWWLVRIWFVKVIAPPARLERATNWFEVRYSIHWATGASWDIIPRFILGG